MGRDVYVLWHARHPAEEDGGTVVHHDEDGSLDTDPVEWRIAGVFSSEEKAHAGRAAAMRLPGFRDEPECFQVVPFGLNETAWEGGYVTESPDGSTRD